MVKHSFDDIRTAPLQKKYIARFTDLNSGLYCKQRRVGTNPFKNAPMEDPVGGTVYFGNNIKKKELMTLLDILKIGNHRKKEYSIKYGAFLHESKTPIDDGYLEQMRVIEDVNFDTQPIAIREAFWAFIEKEKDRWGTFFADSSALDGKFGGDGDCAREELSFGLMVENSYHDIYRIWSRAWLVTK